MLSELLTKLTKAWLYYNSVYQNHCVQKIEFIMSLLTCRCKQRYGRNQIFYLTSHLRMVFKLTN